MTPPYPPIQPIVSSIKVKCQRCDAPIGEQVTRLTDKGGRYIYFRIGNAAARAIHGNCEICGEQFDWTLSGYSMDVLIQNVQNIGKDGTIPARQSST